MKEIPVCQKSFIALHGITKRRLSTIQNSMKETGKSPKDNRGKHNNRPWKLSQETKDSVMNHIGSFKGRSCHYGKEKTNKMYLSEEFSVSKCFQLYKEKYPEMKVSFETYRKIFNENNFNLAFGFPRTDTCSACDKFQAELKGLKSKLLDDMMELEKKVVEDEIKKLTT